jgi:hypothetical protein
MESGYCETDHPSVRDAVKRCAGVMAPLLNGRSTDKAEAEQAAAMAWAVAENGDITASSSVHAPWIAESAARAAETVALRMTGDTSSGERAATAVTAAIARSADYVPVSEKLIALLKAA